MFTNYSARYPANPTRVGVRRTNRPNLLVVHTSEGGELAVSAEALARFIQTPRTATNLASYHYITDTESVIPVVPDGFVAYAAAGGNAQGLHICHPGRAGQSRDDWFDTNSSGMLEQVARWLADKSAEYDIPLNKLTTVQVARGAPGVCGHVEVSQAFGKSTHTDPGKGYPWDWVIDRARALRDPAPDTTPPTSAEGFTSEEDDAMWFYSQWTPDGSWWEIRSDKKARRGPIDKVVALRFIASGVPDIPLGVDELPAIPIPTG
jgi:hypothetical protein